MSERWDRHFLRMAALAAEMSKDPQKQVGAILTGEGRSLLGGGFNGFPRGIYDDPGRLQVQELKLELMVHAERNALLTAARHGVRINGASLYVACIDEGHLWGGCCVPCAMEVIQAGIAHVITYKIRPTSRWKADNYKAIAYFGEAGLTYTEYDAP